jgi:hypothetical protein
VGVPTPGSDALIRLGGMLTGENFWADRAGLDTLGLSGMNVEGIKDTLAKGFL